MVQYSMEREQRIVKKAVAGRDDIGIVEFLASVSGLSRMRIKDAMNKGAVWVTRGTRRARTRIRKATTVLRKGEGVEMYYDARLLSLKPPPARCLADRGNYSVWYKPAGLMAQGTPYGDHCSILRQVELHFGHRREVFPVHRLDREASGLMLIAHQRDAAARLSALFREQRVTKGYRAEVLGTFEERGGSIDLPIDGKPAHTEFSVIRSHEQENVSLVHITIATGRHHQIRRHFAMAGHPVMGDPKYGTGNKNATGMRLVAVSLAFPCPRVNRPVEFILPEDCR